MLTESTVRTVVAEDPEGGFNCAVVLEKSMRKTDFIDKSKPVCQPHTQIR